MIEKLEQVQFQKGNLIIKEGDAAGPMFILEKGRARAFHSDNGAQHNLAFYRDGDFFGELSILNGSPVPHRSRPLVIALFSRSTASGARSETPLIRNSGS